MKGVSVDTTEANGSTVVTVHTHGELSGSAAGELRDVLVDAIVRRRSNGLVVDLLAVSSLDSATVGTLTAAYDAACDVHLDLVLHTGSAQVSDQLHHAGIPACACLSPNARG